MNVNDTSHTCKFKGLSDLCNAYDTLGSRNFVQMAVIRSLDILYVDYMNDFLKKYFNVFNL